MTTLDNLCFDGQAASSNLLVLLKSRITDSTLLVTYPGYWGPLPFATAYRGTHHCTGTGIRVLISLL